MSLTSRAHAFSASPEYYAQLVLEFTTEDDWIEVPPSRALIEAPFWPSVTNSAETPLNDLGVPLLPPGKETVLDITMAVLRSMPALADDPNVEDVVKGMICDPYFPATQYQVHTIPKKDGGRRVIEAPSPLLKKIQRCILDGILYPSFRPSKGSMGFTPGRGILTNAQAHYCQEQATKQVLLKMDLHNFFPSIRMESVMEAMVKEIWQSDTPHKIQQLLPEEYVHLGNSGYARSLNAKEAASRLVLGICYICSLDERLPQGAPTSPFLSNLLMKRLDNTMADIAKRVGLNRYTRYADDMIVSADTVSQAATAKGIIRKLVASVPGLQINEKKTHILRHGRPQRVTGLNINHKVSVSRWKRDNIRAEICNLLTGKAQPKDGQMAKLAGYRAFMRGSDREGWDSRVESFWQRLLEKEGR